MSNNQQPPLTISDLSDIDRLTFIKADTVLNEAKDYLKRFDYDLAVRRSQESFELYLKSLARYVRIEYPATHDLRKQIYALADALKECPIEKRQIARLVLANAVLTAWRSPAFYGDEKLGVGTLFDKREAELALSYAELGHLVCGVVRASVYRQVTK